MNASIVMFVNLFAPTRQFIWANLFMRFTQIYAPNVWGITINRSVNYFVLWTAYHSIRIMQKHKMN